MGQGRPRRRVYRSDIMPDMEQEAAGRAIFLMGPTATGKSALGAIKETPLTALTERSGARSHARKPTRLEFRQASGLLLLPLTGPVVAAQHALAVEA